MKCSTCHHQIIARDAIGEQTGQCFDCRIVAKGREDMDRERQAEYEAWLDSLHDLGGMDREETA